MPSSLSLSCTALPCRPSLTPPAVNASFMVEQVCQVLRLKGHVQIHQPLSGNSTGSRTALSCTLYEIGEHDVQKVLLEVEVEACEEGDNQQARAGNILRWWLAWCQTIPFNTSRIVRCPSSCSSRSVFLAL